MLQLRVNAKISLLSVASSLAVFGCGSSPANANAPGASVSIVVGGSAQYRLDTHCGVLSAIINGQTYYAGPPLADGSGNPPPGWGNPYDDGDMRLLGARAADFYDSAGHTAHFTSTPPDPPQRISACS